MITETKLKGMSFAPEAFLFGNPVDVFREDTAASRAMQEIKRNILRKLLRRMNNRDSLSS